IGRHRSGCPGGIPKTSPLLLLLIQAHRKKSGHGKSFDVSTMRRSWRIIIFVLIMSDIAMLPFISNAVLGIHGGLWEGVFFYFSSNYCHRFLFGSELPKARGE